MDFTQIDEATEAVRVGLPGQIVADDEIHTEHPVSRSFAERTRGTRRYDNFRAAHSPRPGGYHRAWCVRCTVGGHRDHVAGVNWPSGHNWDADKPFASAGTVRRSG